jgi:uncharacterized membrane protein YsdA (DUF1294 family)
MVFGDSTTGPFSHLHTLESGILRAFNIRNFFLLRTEPRIINLLSRGRACDACLTISRPIYKYASPGADTMGTKRTLSPVKKQFGLIASIAVIGLGLTLAWLTKWNPYLIWLASASVITFILYGFDKTQAVHGGIRVPEIVLHGLALAGGFPGGWAGRLVFHHKTRKRSFTIVLWISTILHLILIYWIFLAK